mgnify:CR=1 FL=1
MFAVRLPNRLRIVAEGSKDIAHLKAWCTDNWPGPPPIVSPAKPRELINQKGALPTMKNAKKLAALLAKHRLNGRQLGFLIHCATHEGNHARAIGRKAKLANTTADDHVRMLKKKGLVKLGKATQAKVSGRTRSVKPLYLTAAGCKVVNLLEAMG